MSRRSVWPPANKTNKQSEGGPTVDGLCASRPTKGAPEAGAAYESTLWLSESVSLTSSKLCV